MGLSFAETGRSEANLRFSKKLAAVLITGVVLLIAVVGATSLWISRQHNALARDSAERMVRGGFASLEETLDTVTRDYSLWTEAYHAIRDRDIDWVFSNVGAAVTETGTTDLMMIVEPGAAANYGWIPESGEAPTADLLPPAVIAQALRLLDPLPVDEVVAVHFYARLGAALWLLSASRVMPWEGLPAGVTDADLPRHIFGFRIDEARVAQIGAQFLVGDVAVGSAAEAGRSSLPLAGASGAPVGYVNWTPPKPGADILRQIALPLSLTLVLLAAVAALVSRHVVRSARRLERALFAAQAADRSKTEFLANVSHELRTPMNGIIGIAQLLEQTGLDEDQAEMLKVLGTAARAQMTLIGDLLDISQIESGSRKPNEAPFQPAVTVREVLGILKPEAARKALELRADLDDTEGVTVLGDKDAFKQIVTNIAGNAVKFTREGHVDVALRMSRSLDQVRLVLQVGDTGPGIEPSQQASVFERFVQLDSSLTREAGGTGLGLSITRSLVELMGGEIGLESSPGQGSVFTVGLTFAIVARRAPERAAA